MIVVTITIGILVSVFAAVISIWFLEFGFLAGLGMALGAGSVTCFLLVLRALRRADCDDRKPDVRFSDHNGVSRKT